LGITIRPELKITISDLKIQTGLHGALPANGDITKAELKMDVLEIIPEGRINMKINMVFSAPDPVDWILEKLASFWANIFKHRIGTKSIYRV